MCGGWRRKLCPSGKSSFSRDWLFFQITFNNDVGKYDLEVTTFQMAVLYAWNQRQKDRLSYESLRLATELPDAELRRTLWV